MEVFLFPLVNVTLFPATTKPLHIFEPRYLEMVRTSIDQGKMIAIGYIEDPAKTNSVRVGQPVDFVREIAGFGSAQVIEERINGSLLIFLRGLGKVRLGAVKSTHTPYIVCEAEEIYEQNLVSSLSSSKLGHLHKILIRWIDRHIPDSSQRDIFIKSLSGPSEIIGAFSAYMIRDYDLQQMVLEFDDINDKIEYLYRLFQSGELTNI